jgi:hypothetical protein
MNDAPRASMPGLPATAGAWTSCSMRICGLKYATCGPATISGLPVADSRALTSIALEAAFGKASRPSSRPFLPALAVAAAPDATSSLRSEPRL